MTDSAAPGVARLPAEVIDALLRSAMALDIHAWLAQRLRIERQEAPENHAAQKANLAQQQLQLADQLAAARESVGRQEAGQIVAAADQQDFEASAITPAALVFSDPEPPAPPVDPIRYWGHQTVMPAAAGRVH